MIEKLASSPEIVSDQTRFEFDFEKIHLIARNTLSTIRKNIVDFVCGLTISSAESKL